MSQTTSRNPFYVSKEELKSFEYALENRNSTGRSIYYFQGEGGIGKTWLLTEALKHAKYKYGQGAASDIIDASITDVQDILGMMRAIRKHFDHLEPECFLKFDETLKEFESPENKNFQKKLAKLQEQLLTQFRDSLKRAIKIFGAMVIAIDTFEVVQNSEVGDWLLDSKDLELPGLIFIFAGRLKIDSSKVYLLPVSKFDDDAAYKLYDKFYGPSNIEGINDALKNYVHILNGPQFANGNPLILRMSYGALPFEPTSRHNLQNISSQEFESKIAAYIVDKSLDDDDSGINAEWSRILICMSYLHRRFDKDILEWLGSKNYILKENLDTIWRKLTKKLLNEDSRALDLAFMKGREKGQVQLHDRAAQIVRKHYLIDTSTPLRIIDTDLVQTEDLLHDSIDLYKYLVEGKKGKKQILPDLIAEGFAYALRSDLLKDWSTLPNNRNTKPLPSSLFYPNIKEAKYFTERKDLDQLFRTNQLILNQLGDWIFDYLEDEDKFILFDLMGKIAKQIYNYKLASVWYDKAVVVAKKIGKPEDELMARLSYTQCIDNFSSPDEVIKYLNESMELAESYGLKGWEPVLLNEIGYLQYSRKDNLNDAETILEKAFQSWISLEEADTHDLRGNYAQILNNRALVSAKTGNYKSGAFFAQSGLEYLTKLLNKKIKRDSFLHDDIEADSYYKKRIASMHNVLADIYRYGGKRLDAIEQYTTAIEYSNKTNHFTAKVFALAGRCEARRQHAKEIINLNPTQYMDLMNDAGSDIDEAFNINRRWGLDLMQETLCRRRGRLKHDLALQELRKNNLAKARTLLEEAREDFNKGLKIAEEKINELEKLENSVELIFLNDDLLKVLPESQRSNLIDNALGEIRRCKKLAANSTSYQKNVFKCLCNMEEAAICFFKEDFKRAKNIYLQTFKILGKDSGYGSTRFRSHIGHLIQQIESLPISEQTEWILSIKELLKNNRQQNKGLSLKDAFSDLYEWCNEKLKNYKVAQ